MKKIFLSLLFAGTLSVSAFANEPVTPKKKETDSKKTETVGRQCCSKTFVNSKTGTVLTITACAGNFLVSDDTSMTRACAKANEAIGLSKGLSSEATN